MDNMPKPPQGSSPIQRRPQLPPELEEVAAVLGRMEDSMEWFGEDPEQLERYARAAILAYKGSDNARVAEILPAVYFAYMDSVSVETRRQFFIETWREVMRGDSDPGVLWAIAMYEDHPLMVAMATECFACSCASTDGEAVTVAGCFLGVFEEASEETRAGIFQGLMVLGEAEVFDLLRMSRWELTDDEVFMVCSLPLGDSDSTVYLFLLEWLEEAQAAKDHARAQAIAAALTVDIDEIERTESDATPPEVTGPPSLLRQDEPFWILPVREFARHIEPRLRALADHETGRPFMPAVLEGWGLASEKGSN